MCLVINHRNIKTASRNITVYKMLLKSRYNGKLHAPFRRWTEYVINERFDDSAEQTISKLKSGKRVVTSGFIHAFRTIAEAEKSRKMYIDGWGVANDTCGFDVVIHKAVIPEGTKFYEGSRLDICSKSTIVLDELIS